MYMNIIVNGQCQTLAHSSDLEGALHYLDMPTERAAVLVNDEMIPRSKRKGFALKDGDRVEVLTFAGGG